MSCYRQNGVGLSLAIGLLIGVLIGVLYAFGFVPVVPALVATLAVGLLGIFVSPIYAFTADRGESKRGFCRYRLLLVGSAVGAAVFSVAGLLLLPVATVPVLAVLVGLATFLGASELIAVVGLSYRTDCD